MALHSGAAAAGAAAVLPRGIPLDDYFTLPDDGCLREWVAGEVVVHMTATSWHQKVSMLLSVLIKLFADLRGAGQVLTAPYAMLLTPQGPVREPDVMFVAAERADNIQAQRLNGAADLVVEIVSEDSVSRDRGEKFYEYQQAGVREYWLIDPRPGLERADFWVLDEETRTYRVVAVGGDGVYRSRVLPGFWLRTEWLRADAQPDPLFAFAEMVELPAAAVDALKALRVEARSGGTDG